MGGHRAIRIGAAVEVYRGLATHGERRVAILLQGTWLWLGIGFGLEVGFGFGLGFGLTPTPAPTLTLIPNPFSLRGTGGAPREPIEAPARLAVGHLDREALDPNRAACEAVVLLQAVPVGACKVRVRIMGGSRVRVRVRVRAGIGVRAGVRVRVRVRVRRPSPLHLPHRLRQGRP